MFKNTRLKKGQALILAAAVAMTQFMFPLEARAAGANITVDGNTSDWGSVTEHQSSDGAMSWKAVYSKDGSTLYFTYSGMASSEWDYNYLRYDKISITYAKDVDGDKYKQLQFAGEKSGMSVKDNWYNDIPGSTAVTINDANSNTAGPYVVEAAIPTSSLPAEIASITFAGTTLTAEQLGKSPTVDNQETTEGESGSESENETESESGNPSEGNSGGQGTDENTSTDTGVTGVYQGIVIDGKYSDWDAVEKKDIENTDPNRADILTQAAMVFDGDYVYIYIQEGKGQNAAWAGTHGNGKFSITTDLGKEILIQLMQDGTVSGVEGATAKHVGRQWEISVPASQLPSYQNTISFGLYQSEPFITGVSNLQGTTGNAGSEEGGDTSIGGGPVSSDTNITYDGSFGDWNNYPHTTIQYATAGTHENVVDGSAALYSNGDTLYGHTETEMQAHLAQKGQEFIGNVNFDFGNGRTMMIRVATVDSNGNINWNPSVWNMENGLHEFYLFDVSCWGSSQNIGSLNEHDICYGKMTIDINGTKDQCEYYLDLKQVAKKFNCDATDFKEIKAQFGMIGQKWITTAGTSSGPWAGVTLCVLSVGMVYGIRRKKEKGNTGVAFA